MDKKLENGYRRLARGLDKEKRRREYISKHGILSTPPEEAGEDQSDQTLPESPKMPGKSSENLDFRKLAPDGMSQKAYDSYRKIVHNLPGGWDNN